MRMITKRTIPKKEDFTYGYTFTKANSESVKRNTLFLHGIYGTKEEWDFIATSDEILDKTNTYWIDAVNHWDTSHHPEMSLDNQAQDVIDFADKHEINKMTLIGHGMGGKVAMRTAMFFPDRVEAVMSVDSPAYDLRVFPKYNKKTYEIVKTVSEIDVRGMPYDRMLALVEKIWDNQTAAIYRTMKHLRFNDTKTEVVGWKSNPQYIYQNIEKYFDFERNGKYLGPARMLVSHSNRFKLEHYKDCFPNLKETDIIHFKDAGHWIHLDEPERTIQNILELIKKS